MTAVLKLKMWDDCKHNALYFCLSVTMTKLIFSCINLTVLLLLHYCESNVGQVCPTLLLFLLLVVVVLLPRLLQVVILYANNNNKNGENMTFCVF